MKQFTEKQNKAIEIAAKLYAIGVELNAIHGLDCEPCIDTFAAARCTLDAAGLEAKYIDEQCHSAYEFDAGFIKDIQRKVWTAQELQQTYISEEEDLCPAQVAAIKAIKQSPKNSISSEANVANDMIIEELLRKQIVIYTGTSTLGFYGLNKRGHRVANQLFGFDLFL